MFAVSVRISAIQDVQLPPHPPLPGTTSGRNRHICNVSEHPSSLGAETMLLDLLCAADLQQPVPEYPLCAARFPLVSLWLLGVSKSE